MPTRALAPSTPSFDDCGRADAAAKIISWAFSALTFLPNDVVSLLLVPSRGGVASIFSFFFSPNIFSIAYSSFMTIGADVEKKLVFERKSSHPKLNTYHLGQETKILIK